MTVLQREPVGLFRRLRRKHGPTRLWCGIDVTGFAAVMIAFLFLFMDPRSYPPRSVAVDLPKASHAIPIPKVDRENAILVAVARDGKVFFGTTRVSNSEIPSLIREQLRLGSEKKVYIKADLHARYSDVKEVLDAVREAGIENVAFPVFERTPNQ